VFVNLKWHEHLVGRSPETASVATKPPTEREEFRVIKGWGRLTGIGGLQFEPLDHERHQGVPTVEAQIAGQCAQVVKKPFARQELAQAPVAGVHQVQHSVKQEGQKIEGSL
jgi:hypothetical protein